MNNSENKKMPTPEEIQKDVSEFLNSKYGGRVVVPPNPDAMGGKPGEQPDNPNPKTEINFDLKPTELEAYLKQFVVGQEEALEVLATKICTHFNRMKLEQSGELEELVGNIKSNILMIGPTGVGKTYLIKLIAKKIGVPFVKGDATKFSETGYVGGDVEDLVRNLVHEANGDVTLAEHGIIYLDEIDKIASSSNVNGLDVSRSGVQRTLLKLMEESEVDLKTPHDLASQMEAAMEAQRTGKVKRKKINTKNILFVTSGAFSGLDDIIKRRLNQQPLGFQATQTHKVQDDQVEILKNCKSEDLLKYGFESEFIGRLPIVVTLNNLDVNGLYEILRNEKSTVIQGKKRDFKAYDIDIDFADDALMEIATLAHQENTGARGLVNVADRVLLKYEKLLPDSNLKHFIVTKAIVEHPEQELQKTLSSYYVKKFQKRFLMDNQIVITFTDEAIDLLMSKSDVEKKPFDEICNDMFKDYEYGLRLLGTENFTVDKEIVENPNERLEELIKDTFKK